MKFETIENVLNITFDNVGTLAVAILLLLLGYLIREKVKFFNKFCIPAPVIGGLILSLLSLVFWKTGALAINLDTTFQSPFMLAFFTTVGLGASFDLLKKGGKLLIVYWLLSGVLGLTQNIIGIGMASVLNIDSMYGLMCGAISMVGGHGAAASFGQSAVDAGHNGALVVALAAATFGLISGGLAGGPLAKRLIDKNNLTPSPDNYEVHEITENTTRQEVTTKIMFGHMALITVCMTFGGIIGKAITGLTGLSLPSYIGAMFLAVFVRNINEKIGFYKSFDGELVGKIGDISLGVFLSMALMSLKLWELSGVAGPMLIILIVQVTFILLYAYFIVFRLLGKNFDAAIMCAGMIGSGLGATPNAMANMGSVTEKYGPSKRAYMIVPIVGAFLIDIITMPGIIWFYNLVL